MADPMKGRPVREQIKISNKEAADKRAAELRSRFHPDTSGIVDVPDSGPGIKETGYTFVIGVVAIIGLGFLFKGFGVVMGIVVELAAMAVMRDKAKSRVREINREREKQRQQIRDQAQKTLDAQIRKVYAEADLKTKKEIQEYDDKVNMYSDRILKNAKAIERMVDHNVEMFRRMIAQSGGDSDQKFISAYLIYEVGLYGITYTYYSQYSNPLDAFVFSKERFRCLSKQEECEGLAQALARLTIGKMKRQYPANTKFSVTHEEAKVTLFFNMPNKNFVPPTDIY